jgi:hypothetical protein
MEMLLAIVAVAMFALLSGTAVNIGLESRPSAKDADEDQAQ